MKASSSKEQSRLPTVAAAVLALLATSPGASASGSNALPAPAVAKKPNEDDHTPELILTPPVESGTLFADHSSHASHSSHYSSSGGDDYVPYTPPAPAPTYVPPPAPAPYTPPPAPAPETPQVSQIDPVLLNKLTQVPSMWPKQVKLLRRFGFTEIKDGVAVGVVGAPQGTLVDLLQVKGVKLVVSYFGNKAEIDADITDLAQRIDVNTLVAAPVAPPSTNSPAATPSAPTTPGSTP